MRVIGPNSEDETIAVFLRGELHSERKRDPTELEVLLGMSAQDGRLLGVLTRNPAGGERGGEEPRVVLRTPAHVRQRQARARLLPA